MTEKCAVASFKIKNNKTCSKDMYCSRERIIHEVFKNTEDYGSIHGDRCYIFFGLNINSLGQKTLFN